MKLLSSAIVFLALSPFALPAAAGNGIKATVTRVIDGDTIDVRLVESGEVIRVRVYGINCPERYEPFGAEATKFVKKTVGHKKVELLIRGKGKYGRTLAFVLYRDGGKYRSLNHELLKEGLAVLYVNGFRPASGQTFHKYKDAQLGAMALERGIWKDIRSKRGHKKKKLRRRVRKSGR